MAKNLGLPLSTVSLNHISTYIQHDLPYLADMVMMKHI